MSADQMNSRLQARIMKLVRAARGAGLTIDTNVVDLIADNTSATLADIRRAIVSDPELSQEFPHVSLRGAIR